MYRRKKPSPRAAAKLVSHLRGLVVLRAESCPVWSCGRTSMTGTRAFLRTSLTLIRKWTAASAIFPMSCSRIRSARLKSSKRRWKTRESNSSALRAAKRRSYLHPSSNLPLRDRRVDSLPMSADTPTPRSTARLKLALCKSIIIASSTS